MQNRKNIYKIAAGGVDRLKYRHFTSDPYPLATSDIAVAAAHVVAGYKTAVGECGFSGDTERGANLAAVYKPIKRDGGLGDLGNRGDLDDRGNLGDRGGP